MNQTTALHCVNFASAFRSESSPCLSHLTRDRLKTLCGRKGWATEEGTYDPRVGVDCLKCAAAVAKENDRR